MERSSPNCCTSCVLSIGLSGSWFVSSVTISFKNWLMSRSCRPPPAWPVDDVAVELVSADDSELLPAGEVSVAMTIPFVRLLHSGRPAPLSAPATGGRQWLFRHARARREQG